MYAVLGLILAWAAFRYGGVVVQDWKPCLLGICAIAGVFWVVHRPLRLTVRPRAVPLLAAGFLGVAVFQLVPLPVEWLEAISPRRAEIHRAVARVDARAKPVLSATPAATLEHMLTIAGLLLVFEMVREAGGGFGAAAPLILIGTLEGVLGVVQWQTTGVVNGTYVNRNHYAGLLELCLPFALMWGVAVVKRGGKRHESPVRPAVLACLSFGAACVMLLAVVLSLSRMGFLAVLAGLLAMGLALVAGVVSRRTRWGLGVGALALAVCGFVFLPTDALIGRFAALAATGEITADTRAQIWAESLAMVQDYPLLGCGLGSYESCFHKYKTVAPMQTVNFAHNDYLQLLAETGVIGFSIFLLLGMLTFLSALRQSIAARGGDNRYLAAACLGALTSIGLHSFVDFNLYVAANTMVLAWIAGMVFAREEYPGAEGRG